MFVIKTFTTIRTRPVYYLSISLITVIKRESIFFLVSSQITFDIFINEVCKSDSSSYPQFYSNVWRSMVFLAIKNVHFKGWSKWKLMILLILMSFILLTVSFYHFISIRACMWTFRCVFTGCRMDCCYSSSSVGCSCSYNLSLSPQDCWSTKSSWVSQLILILIR